MAVHLHIIDLEFIQNELNRRKPGQSKIVTQRKEPDSVEFFSEFLKVKQLERQLVLLFTIPIKNLKIMIT